MEEGEAEVEEEQVVLLLVGAFAGRVSLPSLAMRHMESLHRLYFMWLNRCVFSLQVKGHWKQWYLKGLPGGRGM